MRIGAIGAGAVAQIAHLANFRAAAGAELLALAELRPQLGREVAERFGIPRVYASHRALLDDPDIDAVVVVTRRPATGPIVLDALRAGKAVLSEKPMAHTLAQGRVLVQAAHESGVVYAVGYMKRHDAGTARAKAALDALRAGGELGAIVHVRLFNFGGDATLDPAAFAMTGEERPEGIELWPVAPEWVPPERRSEYADFLNVYVHDLNLLRHLLGADLRVRRTDLQRPGSRVAILDGGAFNVLLEFSDGRRGAWHEGIEVYFEGGLLRLTLPAFTQRVEGRLEILRADGTDTGTAPGTTWAFARQAQAFVNDVRAGTEPLAGGRDALADLALAEALWQHELSTRG